MRVAVGVSFEANSDAVCWLLILIQDRLLLSALAVFLLFAFEAILSPPPAVTHKHTFRAGVSNKIQQQK